MAVYPFPVCEYAAIHYIDGRRLENISNHIERRRQLIRKLKWNKIKQNERSLNKRLEKNRKNKNEKIK